MSAIIKTKQLLQQIAGVIKHQHKIAIIKGEDFNIFSILGLETKEVKTHSRFIAALLDPNGKHYFGTTFLELFLSLIKPVTKTKKELLIVTKKTKVLVEKHNGDVNLTTGRGGNIDIYLKDSNGNSISIENKIHADDQPLQLIRYYNDEDKNHLFYLTLSYSKKASTLSTVHKNANGELIQELKEGNHFYHITYKEHILPWLALCLKETADKPILRETIKQYIILIKKLTHSLNMEEKKEITEVLFKNLAEAKYIASHYNEIIATEQDKFRKAIHSKLQEIVSEKYTVEIGAPISSKFPQIWIKLKDKNDYKLWFGVESFSGRGHNGGNLFVGIFNRANDSEFHSKTPTSLSKTWHLIKEIEHGEHIVNLANTTFLEKLHNTKNYNEIVADVSGQINDFIKTNDKTFSKFLIK